MQKHKPFIFAVVLSFLSLFSVNANAQEAQQRKLAPVLVDRVIAYFGDEVITLTDVFKRADAARNPVAGTISGDPAGDLVSNQAALDDLVEEKLILAEAAKLGIKATDEEVDRHVQSILDQNMWSQEDFASAIKMLGFLEVSDYRAHAKKELLKSQVLRLKVGARVRVSDRDVEEAFLREFEGGTLETEVHLWHIFFPFAESSDAGDLVKLIEHAKKIREMAVSNERPFEDLAREFGGDGSAPKGGDVGWFVKGRLQASLENVAFALKDGEISDLVQSTSGLHILRVTERRQVPIADVEEAKARVRYELTEIEFAKEYKKWVKSLRTSSRIVVRPLDEPLVLE